MHVVACTKLAYMHIGHAHSCLHSLNCEVSVRTLTFPWQRMYARLNWTKSGNRCSLHRDKLVWRKMLLFTLRHACTDSRTLCCYIQSAIRIQKRHLLWRLQECHMTMAVQPKATTSDLQDLNVGTGCLYISLCLLLLPKPFLLDPHWFLVLFYVAQVCHDFANYECGLETWKV